MRPQDLIADFLAKVDLSKRSPADAACDLLDALDRAQMRVADVWEDDGDDWFDE